MSRPAFITVKRFVCHSTSDFTGSDDVVGVMGPAKFTIGSFAAGDDVALDINNVVPVGARVLDIIETDVTGDDAIGTISLTEDMDVEVTRNVQGDDANYDFTLIVTSTPGDGESDDTASEGEPG